MKDGDVCAMGRRIHDTISEAFTSDVDWSRLVEQLTMICDPSLLSLVPSEFCAVAYAAAVERCGAWLDALDSPGAWKRVRWPIRSLLFALLEDLDSEGEMTAFLEITARPWSRWEDGDNDDRVLYPDQSELHLPELRTVYRLCTPMPDEEAIAFCQYAFCLGFAGIVLRDVLTAKSRDLFAQRSVFLCWSGGDFVQLPANGMHNAGQSM